MGIIDAAVHPVVPRPGEINAYLAAPYNVERLTPPQGGPYQPPIDEYLDWARPADGTWPGSSADLMHAHVLDRPRADFAILLPLTRGLVGDVNYEVAICAATNKWLASTWLDAANTDGRYKGTIRVSARSPREALDEIERWADHPHFVQVGVMLEAHTAYGDQMYFDIWQRAAEHGLPVVVHADRAGGALLPPTVQGYPQYFLEEYSQQPIYALLHLYSLIAHGVFERLESLVFVFADGGYDYSQTLSWRLDKEWRSSRSEVPWVRQSPRMYFPDHVRFVVHASDGSEDAERYARFIDGNELDRLLMYGSNYPSWDHLPAGEFAASLPETIRDRIMSTNARELYRLPAGAPAAEAERDRV